jgi:hypothetical protein
LSVDQYLIAAAAKPVHSGLRMNRSRRIRPFKDPDTLNRLLLYALLLILVGTFGSTSVSAPNDKLSYAAFALLIGAGLVAFVRRVRDGSVDHIALQAYDAIPLALILVWFYGAILGFALHNQPGNVIRNFAGMTMYLIYYLLLANRIRPFDALRCVLAAAAVNTIYMYGFFGWDKVFGPMLGRPTYFRFIEVRSYYSETMILLAAPIGILARTVWFPPEGLAASHGRKLGQRTIVLLIVYLFAFLSITLSKAALLAFGLAVLTSIVFLGPRLLAAVRTHRLASLAALAAVCIVAIHPASELLGGYVPDSVKRRLPVIDWSAATRVFDRASGPRIDAAALPVRQFADTVDRQLGASDRVLMHEVNAPTFPHLLEPRLIYRGAPGAVDVTEADWTTLEHGEPAEVDDTLAKLGVHYFLAQTAQPRFHAMDLCSHQPPLVQSAPISNGAVTYTFALYGGDTCRPSAIPLVIPTSRDVRRVQSVAIAEDLSVFGKGLGAGLTGGYSRDARGYGFEQNYLNLVHKFGVFAALIFLAYGYTAWLVFQATPRSRTRMLAFASAPFFVGLVMGYGNPTLMSPVMVTMHCVVLYWLRPTRTGSYVQPRSR